MNLEQQNPPPAEPSADAEIADILGLSSTPADANTGGGQTPPEPPAGDGSSPPPSEAGGGEPAPSPPVTPSAGEPTPAPAAAPTTPQGTPQGEPSPSLAPAEPPAAASTPTPDEGALKTASLEATVAALQTEIERLRANPQSGSQPAPAAQSPEQPAGEQPYRYALTLPEKVQQALLSDDPQQNILAINNIVNDLGTIVHNTVLAQVRGEMKGLFDRLSGMAAEAQTGQSREAATEAGRKAYFEKFPAHQNDLILPIISSENAKLAAAYPNAPFDDNYQNALGARVNAALEAITGAKPQVGTEPAPSNTPPARPAAMLPAGNRSAPVTPSGDLGEDIMATLDPFSGG